MMKMNKWYDNILLHPKTRKPLMSFNGDYPWDKIRECLSDCRVIETDYIECYLCWNVADEHHDICAINKLNPEKHIRFALRHKPKLATKDGIICVQNVITKNWYKILSSKDGTPIVVAAGTNNWDNI